MSDLRKVTKSGLATLVAKNQLDVGATYQVVDDNNRLVTAYSIGSVSENNDQSQYTYFTDPATGLKFRTGVRDGKLVVDKELSVGGFSGAEDEGWESLSDAE